MQTFMGTVVYQTWEDIGIWEIFFSTYPPREWKTFAPHTSPGDFLVVHDWSTEFKESDIGDVRVERILANYCDSRPASDWKAMWFVRT